jgi:hypothetical protein
MRIVVEITHPAHVHFYLNPIRILREKGHQILVTSRDKDCTLALLEELEIPNKCLSKAGNGGLLSMSSELVKRDFSLLRLLRRVRPDIVTGVGGVSAAHAGLLAGCPSVVFYNTEEAKLQNAISYPLATRVVVSTSYTGWTPKHRTIRYRGYHELSRLHPLYFQPDRSIAISNGLAEHENTFLIRLVSWKASHDIGLTGWSQKTLRRVVKALTSKGRVLISSESNLPSDLSRFRYTGLQSAIHHVMGHCRLVIGESATMASEAVVMGVPAIYAAPSYRGYIAEQQDRYGMAAFVREPSANPILSAIDHFLKTSNEELAFRHRGLINDCVDVPKFVSDTLVKIGNSTAPTSVNNH